MLIQILKIITLYFSFRPELRKFVMTNQTCTDAWETQIYPPDYKETYNRYKFWSKCDDSGY